MSVFTYKVSLFSKDVRMLEVWKLSIVRYTITIVFDVSFLLFTIAITALISQLIDSSMCCYIPVLRPSLGRRSVDKGMFHDSDVPNPLQGRRSVDTEMFQSEDDRPIPPPHGR